MAGVGQASPLVDLVLSDAGTPTLLRLRGSMGDFAESDTLSLEVGGHFGALAAADLNHDWLGDILATNADADLLLVALGAPQHRFGTAHTIPVADEPTRLAVGDVDNDGAPDVLVITTTAVQILRGLGDGTLTLIGTIPTASHPADLAVSDVSGDGAADVLLSLPNEGLVRLFLGNGAGGFERGPDYPGGRPGAMILGHFNSDSRLDLVTVDREGPAIVTWLGAEAGIGTQTVVSPGVVAEEIATADMNGDRALDIVALEPNGVRVFFGSNDGSFVSRPDVTAAEAVAGLVVSDFNGDQRPDIVVGAPQSSELIIATNIAVPVPQPCVGDCDGNGRVTVDELLRGVDMVLGRKPLDSCFALETNVDRLAKVNELVGAVRNALDGCQ